MKPKLVHQNAMDLSFKAQKALDEEKYEQAFELYKEAAKQESLVAEFYFDKPELEPTRSVLIRSAAFLNLKAGQVEESRKFIFFGLLNTKDDSIKKQLNYALELSISLSHLSPLAASQEYNYLSSLRQKSIHYTIEPLRGVYGSSVSLEMIKNFSDGYLKSLRAYAESKIKKLLNLVTEDDINLLKELQNLINPLVTDTSYGSFKFSIANDYLQRDGEDTKLVALKASIINTYHNEIFINPLTNSEIDEIKSNYSQEDINDIFRPLAKLKSNNSPYKIGYYDLENFKTVYVRKIDHKQKKKLLVPQKLTTEDIGELESLIVHKRTKSDGSTQKATILKQELKSYEVEIPIKQIEPKDNSALILSDEIYINMRFDSSIGFIFSFDDFRIEYSDIEYKKSLEGFHTLFYFKIINLINNSNRNEQEQNDWNVIKDLIGNPDTLRQI